MALLESEQCEEMLAHVIDLGARGILPRSSDIASYVRLSTTATVFEDALSYLDGDESDESNLADLVAHAFEQITLPFEVSSTHPTAEMNARYINAAWNSVYRLATAS